VDLLSIGEFARRCRLSPKALRLYDELGLLLPARVDDESGYRYYAESQLDRALLIAGLRQLQVSLADINVILGLETVAAAERITQHWAALETQHATRRDLARFLVDGIQGKSHDMYEVATETSPIATSCVSSEPSKEPTARGRSVRSSSRFCATTSSRSSMGRPGRCSRSTGARSATTATAPWNGAGHSPPTKPTSWQRRSPS
jgi:DNA-binding transcriptional MerR regulator